MSIEEDILLLSALEQAKIPYFVMLLHAGLDITHLRQSVTQQPFSRVGTMRC